MSKPLFDALRTLAWLMIEHDDEEDDVWDPINDFLSDVLEERLSEEEQVIYKQEGYGCREETPHVDEAAAWIRQNPEWTPHQLMGQ